jgi:leucyl aminopeptidase
MKVQLRYEDPQKVKTDLLVVILDQEKQLHNFRRSPLDRTIDGLRRSFKGKRLRQEYFAPRVGRSAASHLAVYSTSLDPAFNVWENVKSYVARAVRTARDHNLRRVAIVLNTEEAVGFIGKATEGAVLGSYCFDAYKKENKERQEFFDKMRVDLVALKSEDAENRRQLERYMLVSEAVNLARDLINEPGSVVTPERLAREARAIAKDSSLDVRIWNRDQLRKEGFNGLIQVGRGSVNEPRLIRLSYRAKESPYTLALVGKGVTFDTGGISLKPADRMFVTCRAGRQFWQR